LETVGYALSPFGLAADKPKGLLVQFGGARLLTSRRFFAWHAGSGSRGRSPHRIVHNLPTPKGVDWSWPGRIMPAKSGWREGTRHSDFGFFRQKPSNDKVSLSE